METELLKQLLTDPARLPFIFLLAVAIIFVIQIINVAAAALAKHLSVKVKQKRGVLAICKGIAQAIVIALIIYVANATYWTHAIRNLLPAPTEKPISTCTATVELVVQGGDTTSRHFISRGGYLVFGAGDQALLVVAASDSWGRPAGTNEYLYRGILNLDATHAAVGKPVNMLERAEYVQVMFRKMPNDATLVRGRAVCVINSEFRFELEFPKQKAQEGKIFLRDLSSVKELLK